MIRILYTNNQQQEIPMSSLSVFAQIDYDQYFYLAEDDKMVGWPY